MYYIWVILKRDLKSLITPSGTSTWRQRLGSFAVAVILAVLAVALGYGSFRLFSYLSTALGALPELRRAVEINVLNADSLFVLTMVVLVGLQTTYKTIYESDDVGFLLSQPVTTSSVFGAKFITSYMALLATTAGFGLPVWIAFGYARGLGAGFYFSAIVGFLLLLLASHAAVVLLIITAMRYLPGRRLKQMFIAFSAISGVLVVFGSQMISAQAARSRGPMELIEQLGRGQLARMWYLPTTWLANGVLGRIPEFGVSPVGGFAALAVVSIGGVCLAMALSARWYLRGWSGRTEELGAGKTRRRKARAGVVPKRRLQGGYWSVLRKDLTTLWRDPILWYTLAVGAIGLGFYVYNVGSSMRSAAQGMPGASPGGTPPGASAMAAAIMVVMPLIMGAVTSAQTGGISISREGNSFWLVRSSPVNTRELLLAKFTYAILPQALFMVAFGIYLQFSDLPHLPLWLGLIVGGASIAAVASLQMLLDVYFPDFSLKVEFGSAKGGKGTTKLTMAIFASLGLAILIGVVLSGPTILHRKLLSEVPIGTLNAWSYGVILAISVWLVALLFGPGHRRLSRTLSDM